ncbi:TeaA receptor TeaR [Aspergillus luchuensis]|nr:TeaA receptor TeaR [Aspergillus luchuensis]
MADLLAPWPSLAGSGSPPAFYDIMENRRWWPRDLPDGAGSSRGRVRTPSDHRDFPPYWH